jgi:hypothetical protein
VYVENLDSDAISGTAIEIIGIEKSLVENFWLKNLNISKAAKNYQLTFTKDIKFENLKIDGKNVLIHGIE